MSVTVLEKTVDSDVQGNQIFIHDWAKSTLSQDEYQSFLQAQDRNIELMNRYKLLGLVTEEPIYATSYSQILQSNISIMVGHRVVLAPGVTVLDIPIDPEFGAWNARYSSDPKVNYNPTFQV